MLKLANLEKEADASGDSKIRSEFSNPTDTSYTVKDFVDANKQYLQELAVKSKIVAGDKAVLNALSGFSANSLTNSLANMVMSAFGFDNATPKVMDLAKKLKLKSTDIAQNEILDRSFWQRMSNIVNAAKDSSTGRIAYEGLTSYLNDFKDKMKDGVSRDLIDGMAKDAFMAFINARGDGRAWIEQLTKFPWAVLAGWVGSSASEAKPKEEFYDKVSEIVEQGQNPDLVSYFNSPSFKRLWMNLDEYQRVDMNNEIEKALKKTGNIEYKDWESFLKSAKVVKDLEDKAEAAKRGDFSSDMSDISKAGTQLQAPNIDFGQNALQDYLPKGMVLWPKKTDKDILEEKMLEKEKDAVMSNLSKAGDSTKAFSTEVGFPDRYRNVVEVQKDLLLAPPLQKSENETLLTRVKRADIDTKYLGDGPGDKNLMDLLDAEEVTKVDAERRTAERLDQQDIMDVTDAAQTAASDLSNSLTTRLLALVGTHEQFLVTMRVYPIDSTNWLDWNKQRNINDTASRFVFDNVTQDLLLEPRTSGFFNVSGGQWRNGISGEDGARCRGMLETYRVRLHCLGNGAELIPSQETTDMTTNFNGATIVTASSALRISNDTWDAMFVAQLLTNSYPWTVSSEGRSNALSLFKLLAYTKQLSTVWCYENTDEVCFQASYPTGGIQFDDNIPNFPLTADRTAADLAFKYAVTTWRDVIRHLSSQQMKGSGPGNGKLWESEWGWQNWGSSCAVVFLDNVTRTDWRKVVMRTLTKLAYPFNIVKYNANLSMYSSNGTWVNITGTETYVPRSGLVEVDGPKYRVLFVLLESDDSSTAKVSVSKDVDIDQTTNNVYGTNTITLTKTAFRTAYRLLHMQDAWLNNWLFEMRHWKKTYGNYSDWSIAHRMLADIAYLYRPMLNVRTADSAGQKPYVSGCQFTNIKLPPGGSGTSVTTQTRLPSWANTNSTDMFTASDITTRNALQIAYDIIKNETATGFLPMLRLTEDAVYAGNNNGAWTKWFVARASMDNVEHDSEICASHSMCKENEITNFLLEKGYYIVKEEANLKDYAYLFQFGEVIRDMSLKMASAYDLSMLALDIGQSEHQYLDLNTSEYDASVPGGISGKRNALDWFRGHKTKVADLILNSGSQGTFIMTSDSHSERMRDGWQWRAGTRWGLTNAYNKVAEEWHATSVNQRVSLLFINNYFDDPWNLTNPILDLSPLKNDKRSIRFERATITQERFMNTDVDWAMEPIKNWFAASKCQFVNDINDTTKVNSLDVYVFTDRATTIYKHWFPLLYCPGELNVRQKLRAELGNNVPLDGNIWNNWPAGSLFRRVGNFTGRGNLALMTMVVNSDLYKPKGTNRYKMIYGTTGLSTVYDEDNYFMSVGAIREFRSYQSILDAI